MMWGIVIIVGLVIIVYFFAGNSASPSDVYTSKDLSGDLVLNIISLNFEGKHRTSHNQKYTVAVGERYKENKSGGITYGGDFTVVFLEDQDLIFHKKIKEVSDEHFSVSDKGIVMVLQESAKGPKVLFIAPSGKIVKRKSIIEGDILKFEFAEGGAKAVCDVENDENHTENYVFHLDFEE